MLKNNFPFQEKINFTPDKLPEYFHPGKNILAENCARVTIFSLKNPTPLGGYTSCRKTQKVCGKLLDKLLDKPESKRELLGLNARIRLFNAIF